MARTKFVTIESYGVIPALGGILGPITSPCYIDLSVIISLINSGKKIYEVNPKNINEKVLLTRDNVLMYNFDNKSKNNINTSKKPIVKPSNEEIIKPSVNSSGVTTEIVEEVEPKKIGVDLFISNKKS